MQLVAVGGRVIRVYQFPATLRDVEGCNEEMTVGVGIPIQNHDALVRTF